MPEVDEAALRAIAESTIKELDAVLNLVASRARTRRSTSPL